MTESEARIFADLYLLAAQLRERIADLEVMTIALARTHPDGMALLDVLRDAMALPADVELADNLRAHHAREAERIISSWRPVLAPRCEESRTIH
jgi:hypothetical protein